MESGYGFIEEEQMGKGKLPFSYSSSLSPSSSSSHQKGRLFSVSQIYDKNEIGSWLGNKFNPEEYNDMAGGSMDVNEDEDAKRGGGGGGREDQTVGVVAEKEHMFDKVVTPSDVGKLNRLVIPKQHAEKYFPLDSSANEKGLLLNFEDRNGKEWRFRYSYWNSSQSYVMTKGWSRFVKEKKLDAGDIVSFQRGVGELGRDRLYIDWRRRSDAPDPTTSHHHHLHHHQLHHHFSSTPWTPLLMSPPAAPIPLLSRDHVHLSNPNRNAFYTASGDAAAAASYGFSFSSNYNNVVNPSSGSGLGSVFYVRSSVPNPQQQNVQQVGMGMVQWQQRGGGVLEPTTMVYESVPVVQGKAAAKRLRLFGVNMDCPITANDQSDHHHHHHQEPDSFSSISTSIQPHHSAISLQPSQILPQSPLPPQFRLYNGTPLQAIPSPQYLRNEKPSMSLDLDI